MPSHSRIFHHFECLQGQATLSNFKMRCKHCGKEVSGSCKATSNFYTHMKRHHADIHQELKEPHTAPETAPREPRLTLPSSSPHPGTWNSRDPRQRALTDAVVDFLSHSLQPLSLVEDPSFKTLLKVAQPSFSLPTLGRLRYEILPARTASLYSAVSSRLSKISGLCLTLDVWAERGRGRGRGRSVVVVGVAGHYIQDSSFRAGSVLLACRRVRGGSTQEREEGVLSNYQEVISSFGLEDKVVTLITGSGVDDGAAVGLPGWEDEGEEEEEDSDSGENGLSMAAEPGYDPGLPLSPLPHCFPCFSRALESVVGDGLRRAGHLTSAAVRRASKLLADLSRREISSPGLFSDPQRRQEQQQQQQRGWTAQTRALRSVVLEIAEEEEVEEQEPALEHSWQPLPRPPPPPASPSLADFPSDRLSEPELQALRELLGVLRPFELAMEQAEGSGGGGGGGGRTASCVLPCIRGLRAELEEMGRRGGSELLLLALRSSMESRLSGYEGEEAFVLAAALDPRWKLDWCSGMAEALEVKKLLAGKVAAMAASPDPVSSALQTPPKKKTMKMTQTRSGLFRFMAAPERPAPGGAASAFSPAEASQVEIYFGQPCIPEDADPLAFWYHHQEALPHLAHLATMYLATPASPAPVRRLFSLSGGGGKAFGPLGTSLSDFRFEEMMFLRCNGMWK
ncbi:zinc finger BED domain-containing protein 4-like [Polyodon spathula]|uniref:zinc finger BED domain-containing protein 4-like n=1 Tax=Polyodon spathula TaxID=7913 RepID=UPI001B7DCD84|nr:zinc finger BED domain-containing protein 4-like [Polyodon spathula]